MLVQRPTVDEETNFHLELTLHPQPTETSCGPTCLQAVYSYFGDEVPIASLIEEIPSLAQGGTLGVLLGIHALKRGYSCTLYTYNLKVFDPTWFDPLLPDFRERLKVQIAGLENHPRRKFESEASLEFLNLGGVVLLEDLNAALIRRYLEKGIPILTGLSATFLYRASREIPETNIHDDLRGQPAGHFVVLCGYDRTEGRVMIADPYEANPLSPERLYMVDIDRLINAILLGLLTYDANLLIIEPKKKRRRRKKKAE